MQNKKNNKLTKVAIFWTIASGWVYSIISQLCQAARASGDEGNSNRYKYSGSLRADEIVRRFEESQRSGIPPAETPKTGLEALKDLLFDEMLLFTLMGAMVLLVALIGSAVIISKRRRDHHK